MAVDAINRNGTILRDYALKLLVSDGRCSADMVMKSFIDYLRFKHFNRMVGILGMILHLFFLDSSRLWCLILFDAITIK